MRRRSPRPASISRGCTSCSAATPKDALWAFEQALRAPECGAAFAWLPTHDERALRRLQVAAREGRTWGVLWRRPGQRGSATAAPLRLALAAEHDGQLAVRVVKRRGARTAAAGADRRRQARFRTARSAMPSPPVASPRLKSGTQ